MSLDLLFLVPLALIFFSIALLWTNHRNRRALGMPSGEAVYTDTAERPGEVLTSPAHRLKGKPDFLIAQAGHLIPVEAKTGRTPARPYHGHVMQLIAYCVLVEAVYRKRPPYGVIRYPERQFTIDFTPARERELLTILTEMQRQREAIDIRRSHTNPRLCAACGFRDQCDERLPEQTSLWT